MKTNEPRTVDYLKSGDLFVTRHGTKKRPFLILKVGKQAVLACALTSAKDVTYVCDINTRFDYKHIGATVALFKKSYVKHNVVGMIDNQDEIPRIITELKKKLTL